MKKRLLIFGEVLTLTHTVRPLRLAQLLNQDDYEIFFASTANPSNFATDV